MQLFCNGLLLILVDSWLLLCRKSIILCAKLHLNKLKPRTLFCKSKVWMSWLLWIVEQIVQNWANGVVDFRSSEQLNILDTFGSCQRPVSPLSVSQHVHYSQNNKSVKIWTLGRRSYEIIMEEKTPLSHEVVCFTKCLISGPQNLILKSRNQIRGKLLLFRKLRYFRGSRFSKSC